MCKRILFIACTILIISSNVESKVANKATYLTDLKNSLKEEFPNNKTINIVFHGHSVPSGYYKTPIVNTLFSYPHIVMEVMKSHYPNAVLNIITTSIGGENSEQGLTRFDSDVLTKKPDLIFIDYALNDRGIGLTRSEVALKGMIKKSLANGIKVILMTPTPDLGEDILSDDALLQQYSNMIKSLASEYEVGLVDSYSTFKDKVKEGNSLATYMSQVNHPNEIGHLIVSSEILTWVM